jgi:hypothetical protein
VVFNVAYSPSSVSPALLEHMVDKMGLIESNEGMGEMRNYATMKHKKSP